MKAKKISSHFGIIILAMTLSHCSTTTSKLKKDDSRQFKDEVLNLESNQEPELHSSSSLLLKYQERIKKSDKKPRRGPASVESAEKYLEETEEEDEDLAEFKALTEAPEKEETLSDIEGKPPEDDPLQEFEDRESVEDSEWEIETPDEVKNIIISNEASPFEIKELPPELNSGSTTKSLLSDQNKDTSLENNELPELTFPHIVPQIKEGSLLSAAKRATVETLRYLLEKGLDINFRDGKGNSALHYAVFGKRYENIKFLLLKGADPLAKNNKGLNPKEAAIRKGEKEIESLFP